MATATRTRGPALISRNSADAGKDNRVVYFAHCDGTLMLAPDTRVSQKQCGLDPAKWRRCEAVGAKEIEQVSVILARQEYKRKRELKVRQSMQELEYIKQARINAKLRVAMNYSANDVKASALQERRWKAREDAALAVIASECDPTKGFDPTKRSVFLEMEVRPQSTSPLAHVGQKRTGI